MTFYNEDEKKDGAPVIPSGSSSFKKSSAFGKPMFSRTAGGIMERLKNLSRKDMAFVGIGLSVLVMAPVAEYMTSKPSADNLLTPGFGSREGSSATGGVYEPGINALSQGSPDGSGEVITPLSSRDPSSLILGAQPAQAPVAPVSAPPPSTSFRDSMKDVGRNAFSEVSKSAGAPTPIPRMQSALRSFGSFFSGGEGTRTAGGLDGGKIIGDAKSASSKAASHGMVGPVATAGYKGVASSSPHGSSGGAYDKLRSQADRAASNFSGSSAMNSLDRAAAESIDIGKGAGGLGAGGESDKTAKTSNSTDKYEHSRSGESLEEMAAKQRMQKALDWEFFKKYEIPKQIINAIVGAVSTSIGKFVGDTLDGVLSPGSPAPKCWNPPICPDGASCGGVATQYLGANWWTNGKKLSDLCSVAGAPVAYGTKVGKDSATTTSEVCICGKGGSPSSGGAPAGGAADPNAGKPGASSSSTPPQHSAAAVSSLKDYDGLVLDMVKYVAETEASPKKAEANLTSLVGAFQNLSPMAKAKQNMLGTLRDNAETELSGFNTKLAASQTKMSEVQPQYDTFAGQIKTISDSCKDVATCSLKMKKDASISAEAVMTEPTKAKVLDLLKQWNDTGVVFYNSATGNLEAQRKWSGAYSSQLPYIRKGIEAVASRQSELETSVGQIFSKSDIGPVGKLKEISGRLQEVQDSTAAATAKSVANPPLQLLAVNQRALDWTKLWDKKHEFVATTVSEREASEFKEWVDAVGKAANSAAIQVQPSTPENLINNQMRSTQLQSHIKGQLENFTSINGDLDKTVAAIDVIKGALKGYLDPSYFGGAVVPQNNPGADTANTGVASSTSTAGPNTPAVASSTSTAGPNTPAVVNPNAASPEEAKQAAAYKAVLEACHDYGVGYDNGADNCTVAQSDIIKKATEGAVMGRVDTPNLTKRDVTTLRKYVQHACAALAECNKAGYKAAGCSR